MITATERCPHPGEDHLGRIATAVGIFKSHRIAFHSETVAFREDTEPSSDYGQVNHHTVPQSIRYAKSIVSLKPYGTDPWKKFWVEAGRETASLEE